MTWFKRTPIQTEEYEKILKLLAERDLSFSQLSSVVKQLDEELKSFRGRFYQHIGKEKSEDMPDAKHSNTQSQKYL